MSRIYGDNQLPTYPDCICGKDGHPNNSVNCPEHGSVKCTRCAVTVPLRAMKMPNRCTDPACPVKHPGVA